MKRINTKKLREAIKDLNDHRTGKIQDEPKPLDSSHSVQARSCRWAEIRANQAKYGLHRANQLYSLSAEIHGNLHISKQWVSNNQADGHLVLVERTHEDQLKLVEPIVEEFALSDEEVAKLDAERQARLDKLSRPVGETHVDQVNKLVASERFRDPDYGF